MNGTEARGGAAAAVASHMSCFALGLIMAGQYGSRHHFAVLLV